MSSTNTLTITLTEEAAQFIRSRIASGESASETEVLLEGLETLMHSADDWNDWEQNVVLPAHDRLMVDPTTALSVEALEEHLAAKRQLTKSA